MTGPDRTLLQSNKAYAPHIGGIETVVGQLARGWVDAGMGPSTVLATGPGPDGYFATGELVRRIRSFGTVASLPLAPTYPIELLRSRADVLCLHEPFLLGSLAATLRPKQFRERFGRIAMWWHSDIVRQSSLKKLYEPILRNALKIADTVIVATPNHVTSSAYLGEFADKIKVVPFGVPIPGQGAAKPERFNDIEPGFVLFVGRLVYYKGVDVLMDAVAKANVRIVMVGGGPLEPLVRESDAMRSGLVRVFSGLSEADLAWLYENCGVFTLPSVENSEAFGIVQIEAMMRGKPVVSSDLPTGVTWVNIHGKSGLVVKRGDSDALADALRSMVSNPSMAMEMGAFAKERALTTFSESAMIQGFLAAVTDDR